MMLALHAIILSVTVHTVCGVRIITRQGKREGLIGEEQASTVAEAEGPVKVAATTQMTYQFSKSWRVDPDAPFLVSPAKRIFDDGPDNVSATRYPTVEKKVSESSATTSIANDVSVYLKVKANYRAFDAAAQASLEEVTSEKTKMYQYTSSTMCQSVHLASDIFDAVLRLTPSAKEFLLTASLEDITASFGEFYADEVDLGAVFQVSTATPVFESETDAKVKSQVEASGSSIFTSAAADMSVGGSSSYSDAYRSYKSTVKAVGGVPQIWLQVSDSEESRKEVQNKWAQSVTEDNQFPVKFRLVPLWNLLNHTSMDPAKAERLKSFMLNRWASTTIPTYPPSAFNPRRYARASWQTDAVVQPESLCRNSSFGCVLDGCPPGHVPILDEQTCRDVAGAFCHIKGYWDSISSSRHPKGCFITRADSTTCQTIFNRDYSASSIRNGVSICEVPQQ